MAAIARSGASLHKERVRSPIYIHPMHVQFLAPGSSGNYYDFGTTRVPVTGDVIWADSPSRDGLPRGTYIVTRVVFKVELDSTPTVTCIVEPEESLGGA
jgi:hypothetical protein